MLWLFPILLVPFYGINHYLLHVMFPGLVGLPSPDSIYTAILIEAASSPLWVVAGFAFTYFFGGVLVVDLMRLFASSKLFGTKFVISSKSDEKIDEISSAPITIGLYERLSERNFFLCFSLALTLNLCYILLIQRYFQGVLGVQIDINATATERIFRYFLSPRLILIEFGLAFAFLPLISTVIPLLLGRIKVRQIDAQNFHIYWLSYVYGIAGGASLVIFLLNTFESKGTTGDFILASVFICAILSWYIALGMNLAGPRAERRLANGLVKMRGRKNFFFGQVFVGTSKDDVQPI